MRALITGAGGFVGPYLTDSLLRSGVECFGTIYGDSSGTSAPDVATTTLDIRDREALTKYAYAVSPDVVVHLAAISDIESNRRNPCEAFEVNLGGTVNLLEAVCALRRRPRVLLVSSGAVYGASDSGPKGFSETDSPRPSSTYAASKLMAEEAARCYVRDHDLDVVIARPFNHTGPGQSPEFVCSGFARQIADSISRAGVVAVRTGALDPRRDFTDVRDVVAAYRLLLAKGRAGEVYNVCSGSLVSIREILSLFAEAAGRKIRVEVDASKLRAHEIACLGGDASKLRDELGWAPQIAFNETLHDLLDYWRQRTRVAA